MIKNRLSPILCFALAGAVVAADRLTKAWALETVGIGGEPLTVIDGFFYITCHRNSGMAWGLFQGGRAFFVALTAVLLVVMAIAFVLADAFLFRAALSLAIGGAIGNFIDRVADGSVVDFLDFYIFGYNFPTFNVADMSLVFATTLICVYLIFAGSASDPGAGSGSGAGRGSGSAPGSGSSSGSGPGSGAGPSPGKRAAR